MQLGNRALASAIVGHDIPANAGFIPVTLEGVAGVFSPVKPGVWEVHCAAEPHMRGRQAMQAFRTILDWWWSEHPTDRLVTQTKASHAQARCTAIHLGFSRLGTYDLRWPDGAMHSTVMYEMRRGT